MSDLLDQRDDYRRMCDAKHPRKNQPLRAACQEGRSKCQHQGVISNTVLDHMFQLHITPEAGLSPIKSTIAENGMGMTSRP